MRGSYLVGTKRYSEVRFFEKEEVERYSMPFHPEHGMRYFGLVNVAGKRDFPLRGFTEETREFWGSLFEWITPKRSLPLQAADLDGSEDSIVSWIKKYGIPLPAYGANSLILFDGQDVHVAIRLKSFQDDLRQINAAVTIMQMLALGESEALREILTFEKNEVLIELEGGNFTLNTMEYHGYEGDDIMILAALVFMSLIEKGANKYLAKRVIYPSVENAGENNLKFYDAEAPNDAMSFAWGVLKDELLSGSYCKWHYRRCLDCGEWEDLSSSGRRKTWTRCDACAEKRRKQQSRERSKKARERQK
jgi:hypothetical protein